MVSKSIGNSALWGFLVEDSKCIVSCLLMSVYPSRVVDHEAIVLHSQHEFLCVMVC